MAKGAVKTGSKRLANGRFALGNSGNPKGRPYKPEIEELREALEAIKKEKGEAFLLNFVRRAYKDNAMAIALAKKILPDKVKGEGFDTKQIIYMLENYGKRRNKGADTGVQADKDIISDRSA